MICINSSSRIRDKIVEIELLHHVGPEKYDHQISRTLSPITDDHRRISGCSVRSRKVTIDATNRGGEGGGKGSRALLSFLIVVLARSPFVSCLAGTFYTHQAIEMVIAI